MSAACAASVVSSPRWSSVTFMPSRTRLLVAMTASVADRPATNRATTLRDSGAVATRFRIVSFPAAARITERSGFTKRNCTASSRAVAGQVTGASTPEVQLREQQRFGQGTNLLGRARRVPRVHLQHHLTGETRGTQQVAELGTRLTAPTRHEMFVTWGSRAVGQVHMGQPGAHPRGQLHGVHAGGRGVREVQRVVPVPDIGRIDGR